MQKTFTKGEHAPLLLFGEDDYTHRTDCPLFYAGNNEPTGTTPSEKPKRPTPTGKHIVYITTEHYFGATGMIVKPMSGYDLSEFHSWEELRTEAYNEFAYMVKHQPTYWAETQQLKSELEEDGEDCIMIERIDSATYSIDGKMIDYNRIAPEVFQQIHNTQQA